MAKNIFMCFSNNMEQVNNISFGAKLIKKVKIKKYDKLTNEYISCRANFVQLEPGDRADINVVDSAAKTWKDAEFIKKIATASHWMNVLPIELFALTLQKNNFEQLNCDDILGFAEMRTDGIDPKYKSLYHFQIRPDAKNINQEGKKIFKKCGRTILKSLKKIYKNISLISVDNPKIESFYSFNGFIRDCKINGRFLWSSSIIERTLLRIKNYINRFGY